MSSWRELPFEVLEPIFKLLLNSRTDLLECQFVCKNWSGAAQRVLFDKVILRTSLQLTLFANATFKYGPLVKSFLIVQGARDETALQTNVPVILKNSEESREGGCLLLNSIPEPSLDYKEYVDTARELRDSLTTLFVSDQYMDNDILKLFYHLDRISFHFKGSGTSLSNVFSFVQNYQSLKYIDITQTNTQYNRNLHLQPFITNSDPHTTKLKTLILNNVISGEPLIRHLMNTFTQLDKLYITFFYGAGNEIPEPDRFISTNTVIDFFKYLYYNVKIFQVSDIAVENALAVANEFLGSVNFTGALYLYYASGVDPSIKFHDSLFRVTFCHKEYIESQVPAHQGILEQCGVGLTGLWLSFTYVAGRTHEVHYKHFFNVIFETCPNISSLRINDISLTHCDPRRLPMHSHLKEVTLRNCNLNDGTMLTRLSEKIPNLKVLNMDCNYFSNNNHYRFIMPNSSLDYIYWIGSPYERRYLIYHYYLKISCSGISSYYAGGKGEINYMCQLPADDEYVKRLVEGEESLLENDMLLIEIECTSIKAIIFDEAPFKAIIKCPGQENDQEIITDGVDDMPESYGGLFGFPHDEIEDLLWWQR